MLKEKTKKPRVEGYVGCVDKRSGEPYYLAKRSDGKLWVMNGDYNIESVKDLFINLENIFPDMAEMPYRDACLLISKENDKLNEEVEWNKEISLTKANVPEHLKEEYIIRILHLITTNPKLYMKLSNKVIINPANEVINESRDDVYYFLVDKMKGSMRTNFADLIAGLDNLPSNMNHMKVNETIIEVSKRFVQFVRSSSVSVSCTNQSSIRNVPGNWISNENQNQEENTMLNTVRVSTTHAINGEDVTEMSMDKLISTVSNLEANIVTLNLIETKSKAITKEIAKQKVALSFVVKHLDAKFG